MTIGTLPAPKVHLIVGPSPSRQDLRAGILFSHPVYDVLKEALSEFGLPSSSLVFGNAVTTATAKPSVGEISRDRQVLVETVGRVLPSHALLLGSVPFQSVVGRAGVSSGRGRVLESVRPEFAGPVYFATWHPSILEIQPNLRRQFRDDVRAFVAIATGAEQRSGIVRYNRTDSLTLFDRTGLIAYDLETNGLIRNAYELPRVWMCGVSTRGSSGIENTVTDVFDPGASVLVGHNSRQFDDAITGFQSHDTQIMGYVLDNSRTKTGGYGLQALAREYLGVPAWKDDVTWDWSTWDQEELNVQERTRQYCARDTQYTLEIAEIMMPRLKEQGKWALYEQIYLPVASVFSQIHRDGVYVDPSRVASARSTLENRRDTALNWLQSLEWTPKKFNPGSSQQVARVAAERWSLFPTETTDSGLPKIDNVCLRAWSEQAETDGQEEAQKFCESILGYRRATKHLSTYVGAFERAPDALGRVHPSYKIHATDTGRSATTDFPLHQLPRDVLLRGCMGAPPGYVFGSTDYSNIEQRVIAWLAQEPTLLAQFQAYDRGETRFDNHTLLAAKLLEKSPGSVTSTERSLGKNIGFATQYLGTSKTIQDWLYKNFGLHVSGNQAETYRAGWFESYPGLSDWYESVWTSLVGSGGIARGVLGNTREFGKISVDGDRRAHMEIYRQATNFQVQSFANYLGFAALIGLSAKTYRPSFIEADFKIVGYVHDSILWEAKEEHMEYCRDEVERSMIIGAWAYLRNHFPDLETGRPIPLPLRVESEVNTHWEKKK